MTLNQYEEESLKKIYELDHYLRDRTLKDPDNQRMRNELGQHFDQGNLTMFLEDPEVEPTNNIAERMLRPAIVARKVSQCSKTERGANAYAAFKSVLSTLSLRVPYSSRLPKSSQASVPLHEMPVAFAG